MLTILNPDDQIGVSSWKDFLKTIGTITYFCHNMSQQKLI